MKYQVIFHARAILDIEASFDWGVRNWGKRRAAKWSRQFYATCKRRLSKFPESCSIAPESEGLDIIVRQLLIDRYRVLFIVENDTVEIQYVRGAYVSTMFDDEDEES